MDELDDWIREVCEALGLPAELAQHRDLLLDVARDAAHNVARPAAPLTTFLVGFAAGRSGDVAQIAEVVTRRALKRGEE